MGIELKTDTSYKDSPKISLAKSWWLWISSAVGLYAQHYISVNVQLVEIFALNRLEITANKGQALSTMSHVG